MSQKRDPLVRAAARDARDDAEGLCQTAQRLRVGMEQRQAAALDQKEIEREMRESAARWRAAEERQSDG